MISTSHLPGNRPRVFLSHSKADIGFIQRLYDDLRHCQMFPWLDSEEIRHGQPWLDAIFDSGIPTCDAILVYLTPNSIESPMVKKEMDVGIIKKLRDNHIALLPYISDAKLREQLRPDIQALQTLEWNSSNYEAMLPRVVAEIWHSFSDRQVVAATNAEKARRLEAELELERLKKSGTGGIFSEQEAADFEYIWAQLDKYEQIELQHVQHKPKKKKEVVGTYNFRVHLQYLVGNLDKIMDSEYTRWDLNSFLFESIRKILPDPGDKNTSARLSRELDLLNELRMYGLLQLSQKTESPGPFAQSQVAYSVYCNVFSEKMLRFKYWLAFYGRLPDQLKLEREECES